MKGCLGSLKQEPISNHQLSSTASQSNYDEKRMNQRKMSESVKWLLSENYDVYIKLKPGS